MIEKPPYDCGFYAGHEAGSASSAARVVPLLIRALRPQSVLDVGCGTGVWLAAFAAEGVADYLGLDGDYVESGTLRVPRERFRAHDLTKPFELGRRFDLALSLEVAEHLDAAVADQFVACLVRHSDKVCFSAAVPGQMGTHHVNCQPLSYWCRIFGNHGYGLRDCIRGNIWDDPRVEWWYAQNTVLFVKEGSLDGEADRHISELGHPRPVDIVHPKLMAMCEGARLASADEAGEMRRRPFRNLARRVAPEPVKKVVRGIKSRRSGSGAA